MSVGSKLAVIAFAAATAGCAGMNEIDARLVGGGIGGYIGNELSDGNGYATAAGAALGAGIAGAAAERAGRCEQTETVRTTVVNGQKTTYRTIESDCDIVTGHPGAQTPPRAEF